MEINISGVSIECVHGDIAFQPEVMALVNAANAWLRPGGGVAGAIHRAAGPGLDEECRALAPIRPGEAVISGGHALPNPYVIHCLGPVYGRDKPEEELLASCYRRALQLAEQHGLDSIAFPAISSGAFGYPPEEAAAVVFRVIREYLPQLKHLKKIRFVLFSRQDLELYKAFLARAVLDER